jgi:hypothetical protein
MASARVSSRSRQGQRAAQITSFTATGASGTFTFNAVAVPGTNATGSKVVTEGVFNVRFVTP